MPSLLLCGLVIPLVIALPTVWRRVVVGFRTQASGAGAMVLVVALTALLAARCASRRGVQRVSTRTFLLVSLASFAVIKIAYVLVIDPPAVNDFGRMWDRAQRMAQGHWPQWPDVYMDRALPFLTPLARLFGAHPLTYKLGNVAAELVGGVLAFDLARRWFDERVARASLVITSLAPETFGASAIATHDIPGALFFLLLVWLFDRLYCLIDRQRVALAVSLGFALGIALELADLQRGLFPFWTVGIGIAVVGGFLTDSWRQQPTKAAWLLLVCGLLVPVTVRATLHRALEARGTVLGSAERADFTYRLLGSCSDSWGDGSWGYAYDNYLRPYNALNTAAWKDLALTKLVSDTYYDPLERAVALVRKAPALFSLGDEVNFYVPAESRVPTRFLTQRTAFRLLGDWSAVYSFVLEVLLVVALLVTLVLADLPERTWPAFLVLSTMSLFLLLFGEVQSRYMFLMWFLAPMPICAWLTHWRKPSTSKSPLRWRWFVGFNVALLIAFASAYAVLRLFVGRTEMVYLDLGQWRTLSEERPLVSAGGSFARLQPTGSLGHFRLALQHPGPGSAGNWVGVGTVVPVKTDQSFCVHVRRQANVVPQPGSYLASVWADGKEAASVVLDSAAAKRLVVSRLAPKDGVVKLEFRVSGSPTIPPYPGAASPPVFFEFAALRPVGSLPRVIEVPSRSEITLFADPNPVVVCDGSGAGITNVHWSVAAGSAFELRVGSATGPAFWRSTRIGSALTGKWVRDGLELFLVDVSDPALPTTLASLAVSLTDRGCPQTSIGGPSH